MRKAILSLFIVIPSISAVFATAMDTIKVYTEHLEKAVVLHDLTNTNLYAQPLSELVMWGRVSKVPVSQPTYKGENLSAIKEANYGIRNTAATAQERKDMHRALDALASVLTLQQWWSHKSLPEGKNFNVSKFMEPGEESEPHYAHRLAACEYFKEQVTRNSIKNHEESTVGNLTDLDRLFFATNPPPQSYINPGDYPSVEYKNSTYQGIVHVSWPLYLGLNSAPLKQLYPWINTIHIPAGFPKGVTDFDFTGVNVITEKGEGKEGKKPRPVQLTKDLGFVESDSQSNAIGAFQVGIRVFMSKEDQLKFQSPLQALYALEKGDVKDKLSVPFTSSFNRNKYVVLFGGAIGALSSEDNAQFRKYFESKSDFGRLTLDQRNLVLQMLHNKNGKYGTFLFNPLDPY